jgi:hypothetical protein
MHSDGKNLLADLALCLGDRARSTVQKQFTRQDTVGLHGGAAWLRRKPGSPGITRLPRRSALLGRLARPHALLLGADPLCPFPRLHERRQRLVEVAGLGVGAAEVVVQYDEPAPRTVIGCRQGLIDRLRSA